MKKTTKLLILFMSINFFSFGQEKDSLGFENFKKFLPYVMKGISNDSTKELDERTSGEFQKPWKVKRLQNGEVDEMFIKLVNNQEFKIEQDYRQEWKLDFFTQLQSFETIEEIYKSNNALSNIVIQVSDIMILDDGGENIYLEDNTKIVKNNESKELTFNSGQINTTFPIRGEYISVNGSILLNILEYTNIVYKEFNEEFKNIEFDLGEYKGLKLLKVDRNRAYFILPTIIDDIEITSTNKQNEEFSSHSKLKLPYKVYDFVMNEKLDENTINSFIDKLTIEDVYEKSQILIYETNGSIENLYIHIKSKPINLGSKTLEIKI